MHYRPLRPWRGGAARRRSLDHPAMRFAVAELGSLVLDVHGGRLDATFLTAGGVELDRFTIVKGDAGSVLFADDFELGDASAWSLVVP
ncbi:MAG: hypothetical protein HC897_11375 [Thermoanaerobaculia bacterium]|nr:hypothetical protein [Thermoanaerobaculia bacterium]